MPTTNSTLLQDNLGSPAASLSLNLRSVMHRDLREWLFLPGYGKHDGVLFPEITFSGRLALRTLSSLPETKMSMCADQSTTEVDRNDETFFSTPEFVSATASIGLLVLSLRPSSGRLISTTNYRRKEWRHAEPHAEMGITTRR